MTPPEAPQGSPAALLPDTRQWLPLHGRAQQLMLLLALEVELHLRRRRLPAAGAAPVRRRRRVRLGRNLGP